MSVLKRTCYAAAFVLALFAVSRMFRPTPPSKQPVAETAAFSGGDSAEQDPLEAKLEAPASSEADDSAYAGGLYDKKSGIRAITKRNVRVVLDGAFRIIEFYSPSCHHCKVFAPTFERAVEDLRGIADVAAINCEAESDLCVGAGISGYPAVKAVYHAGDASGDERAAVEALKAGVEFSGSRSVTGLRHFALNNVPRQHLVDLLPEESAAAFAARSAPRVAFVYVPDAAGSIEADALAAALSIGLRHEAEFLIARDPQARTWIDLALGDRPHPALAAVDRQGAAVWYDGAFKIQPMLKWARARLPGGGG